ncbi:MAG: glycosyltransferase [Petrimonas sp.]|uniref:glycosyltransferase family 2 protein n=1 Tax=Dysgonomonadaceae TaxID=2005520 RepID=UPI002B2158C4|nr:glycosyltransferase [Proteiniphilum sp.]MEA5046221.1 glycosyltransferase [Petrimonas sp.]MEA5130181.1 glycosyltransferase [Proteiniphilum sp.]
MDQDKQISKPRVSVIIPVYNTEAYVEEAVRSIMNQTFRDLEIIIVDDGSTDNSLTVIKKLAIEDNRIAYYPQTNQGQSVARNVGIEKARGEYIYFMDSDDVLEEEAFASCVEMVAWEKLDFVLFNAEILNEHDCFDLRFDYKKPRLDEHVVYSGKSMISEMLKQKTYRCSPCIHFISLKTINSLALRFYPGIIHEDELFTALLYIQSPRTAYIPKTFFKRRLRAGSVMTSTYSLRNVECYSVVAEQLINFAKKKDPDTRKLIYRILSYILDPNIYRVNSFSFRERSTVLLKCIEKKMIRFISMKTCVVLLFPWTIRLKGSFRSRGDRPGSCFQ